MRELNTLIGIPYRNRGRDRSSGLDCWGLLCLALREVKMIELPDLLEEYGHSLDDTAVSLVAHSQKAMIPNRPIADSREARTGDVVLMTFPGKASGSHVGMFVEPGGVLHIEAGKQSVLEDLRRLAKRLRIEGYYRVG